MSAQTKITRISALQKNDLLSLANSSLKYWHAKLQHCAYKTCPLPEVKLNQRGRIAGSAVLQRNVIRLQPMLFFQNQDYYHSDVIPHELAHLAVYHLHGKVRPHGVQWQNLMINVLNVKPLVTHQLDVKAAGIRTFSYACRCGKYELSAVRHNRIQKQSQRYICTRCKEPLAESLPIQ
uniref:SprT-like domain-containing protein n=1 Tax=Ningiella ruwaisensis TaxID=2364274 RepID=UPI0010A01F2B|nr:SprT-like domain-containing protein [Ningiella ruwaisensis]